MKILWVADYDVKQNKGGAQQTNDVMIKEGLKRGHTIKSLNWGAVMPLAKEFDLIVLNNIAKFEKAQIDELLASGKCVRYEHDLWVAREYPDLYKKVNKTIFLSPLHRDTVFEKIGYKIDNYELVPSPIDSKIFKLSEKTKEKNSVLCVGNLCEDKGVNGMIEYAKNNPQLKFYCIGWGASVDALKEVENIEYVGELDQKDIVKWYQKCEYFYHRPILYEAFGRTVIEAYLCGCNLLLNGRVGAISWNWDFSNYDEIKENVKSEKKFWDILETT